MHLYDNDDRRGVFPITARDEELLRQPPAPLTVLVDVQIEERETGMNEYEKAHQVRLRRIQRTGLILAIASTVLSVVAVIIAVKQS